MDPVDCPCLSQKKFAECCQPYLLGKAVAPTAEALMRSRYTAYTQGQIDYVNDTLAPEERKTFDRKSATEWSKRSKWLGLEIQSTEGGQPGDAKGMVEFTANFIMDGKQAAHHEKALFRFDEADKCWYFVEPEGSKNTPIVKAPEPGRNDPCSCGSGKKYKKCHG